uniref:Uncharacterized protein n=1 Tax=Arundo donax TaxID=35708 RepID=A0A0A9AUC2_ARUDO
MEGAPLPGKGRPICSCPRQFKSPIVART